MLEKIHQKLSDSLDVVYHFFLWVYPAIVISIGAIICKAAVKSQPDPIRRLVKSITLSAIVSVVLYVTLSEFSWGERWTTISIFFCALIADYVLEGIVVIGENFIKSPEKNLAQFGRYMASIILNRK